MNHQLIKSLKNPLQFSFFLLRRLPIGLLTGLKIKEISEEKVVTTINFSYITQNPFRSIYFACLAMAAELASGLLGIINTFGTKPTVSMLIVHIDGAFLKKAKGKVYFTCVDGLKITQAVQETRKTGKPQTVVAESFGVDEAGNSIANFKITWSFKAKIS